ncbi:MAG: YkvA family protein [Caldimonas sp.]
MLKRLTLLWTVVRHDARRLWFALRHPAAPVWLKAGAALIVLYVISPIDLIPDFIPVIGFVDDIVIVPLAIRWLLNRLPAEIAQAATNHYGIGPRAR